MLLTWLGHATVIVELDDTRIVVDPLVRRRVAHLRRLGRVPLAWLRPADAVLLTHLHRDHLDLPSLRRVGSDAPLVVPRGAGAWLRRRHAAEVIELDEGETTRVGRCVVRAVHADHGGGRGGPFGPRAPALGYLVEGSQRVYLAGDTGLFEGMAALAPIDAAALPVWGWGPSLGPGHLDPEAAVEALVRLAPRLAVPIHFGTYAPIGLAEPTRAPALRFARLAATKVPATRVVVLEPGDTVALAPAAAAQGS